MSVFFATGNEYDIAFAVQLSNKGFEVVFYSPNPYISTQSLHYSTKTHHTVTNTEFIKLCSLEKFRTVSQPEEEVDELWIAINTIKDGNDKYMDAENFVKTLALKIKKVQKLVLYGLTKPGEANSLISCFQTASQSPHCPVFFVGSTLQTKTPAWSNNPETPETISGLNPVYFDNVESAEAATLSILASEALKRMALLNFMYHFKNDEIIHRCLDDIELLNPIQRDVLKYLALNIASNIMRSVFKNLVKKVVRKEKEIVSNMAYLSRKSSKPLQIMVIFSDESGVKRLESELSGLKIKTVYVDENTFEEKGANICRGFDGVIVFSQRLNLVKMAEKACKTVWFLPTL